MELDKVRSLSQSSRSSQPCSEPSTIDLSDDLDSPDPDIPREAQVEGRSFELKMFVTPPEADELKTEGCEKIMRDSYMQHPFLQYSLDSLFPHVASAVRSAINIPSWMRGRLAKSVYELWLGRLELVFSTWRYFCDLDIMSWGNEIRGPDTTLLHVLVEYNLVDLVRAHVKRGGVDLNSQCHFGSALQLAALKGHEDMVGLLLGLGADVSVCGGQFGTALHAAAYRGSLRTVEMLLAKGASVEIIGAKYGTVLQAAACSESSSKALIQTLLSAGADPNAVGGSYHTALQAAAHRGKNDIITVLLQAGADSNALDGKGGTALAVATAQGQHDTVQLLLRRADPTITDCYENLPITIAEKKGYHEISRLLKDSMTGMAVNEGFGVVSSDNAVCLASSNCDEGYAEEG